MRTFTKLIEEVGEIGRALLRDDTENLKEEIADSAMVLCHLARALGTSLRAEMKRKLKVLWHRVKDKQAA